MVWLYECIVTPALDRRLHSTCRIDDLSFRYHGRSEDSLSNVTFTLYPGEVLLLAGPSGCGKTTLLRCMNGLIPRGYRGKLTGSVQINGEEVRGLLPARLAQSVGTLLQDPEKQIVGAHVRSEVAFGPENLGLPADEIARRVDEALGRMNLRHLANQATFSLSGGEKQKVALAGILAMRPTLLLLDEPLASLDPMSARDALLAFRQLADAGATVVLVEHRVEDAFAIRPDRVLYLQQGRVGYDGPADGLAEVAEWREIKLPARQVIERLKREGQTGGSNAPRGKPEDKTRADPTPLLAFEEVSFHYDDGPEILRDITLEIRRGDRIALLGPNATGKSTLVKLAIGLLKPSRGRVLIDGRDTRELTVAQVARTVGYCFQSPTQMLFAPTVTEELTFGPNNLGFEPQELRASVARSITLLNLVGVEQESPLALSFGQQKRVTIASVLAMQSRILALDEPTAGQDYGNYMAFMDQLLGTRKHADQTSGVASHFDAILFITHDLDLAITYASRILLLAEGRIAADGRSEDLLSDHALLARCRLLPTSLLSENLRCLDRSGRFLRAEELARLEA